MLYFTEHYMFYYFEIVDQPESRTVDGYKTHLELLSKRLKSKDRQTVYTACMIGQCLSELKQNYQGNKKLFICATKHLLLFAMSIFSMTCLISR